MTGAMDRAWQLVKRPAYAVLNFIGLPKSARGV